MLTEPVPPHLDINWFITKTYPTLSHAYAYLKNFHLKCMTFIWEIKKLLKKRFFHWTINAHLSPVFCTHHIYYDLTLHHILDSSELFLQGMYKTRHLSSTATAKGWKKQSLCFYHGLFQLQISTLLLCLSLFMFNLELQQKCGMKSWPENSFFLIPLTIYSNPKDL